MTNPVGILGIATYLPPHVRDNQWWTAEHQEQWRGKRAKDVFRGEEQAQPTPLMERTMAAMREWGKDPFGGARSRHVMPEEMTSSDMEVLAAKRALQMAELNAADVDVLLIQSTHPDYLHTPNVCTVHRQLGLSPSCFSLQTEGMCNAWQQQLILAESLISSGQGRYALIIQSSAMTRSVRAEDRFSTLFGDGAAATVLGAGEYGYMGMVSATDGDLYGGVVTGVPGGRWWQASCRVYLERAAVARQMVLQCADWAADNSRALAEHTGVAREEVGFFASHQATRWFGEVMKEACGYEQAATAETFAEYGSLSGANIPAVLERGLQQGALKRGDIVATFAGAAGVTRSSTLMRWSL